MVKSKKIEKKWCSPHKENNGYTCYSLNDLQKIAKSYNQTSSSHQKIKISGKSRKQLWDGIRQALSNKCNNEICWAKQDFMNDRSIIKETFRPKMPQKWKEENLTTWLNTDDINRVMKQYEKKYPDFFFVGPIPLDCGINSDLQCQLTNFDINKMHKKGINYLGMIINTDVSSGPGIHWYSLMIDLKKRTISHFDSYGEKPLKETYDIMKRIKNDYKNGSNIDLKLEYNNKRFQRDGYNCGMYSLFFIIAKLQGKTMAQIQNMKLDTQKMQKFKREWYRN